MDPVKAGLRLYFVATGLRNIDSVEMPTAVFDGIREHQMRHGLHELSEEEAAVESLGPCEFKFMGLLCLRSEDVPQDQFWVYANGQKRIVPIAGPGFRH